MSKTKTPPIHETFYVSVAAAIYNPAAKEFLVLKDADEAGEYFKKFGPWELPGGRLHSNEQVLDALKREVQEETGLTEVELVGVVDANLSQLPYKDGVQGFLVTYLAYASREGVAVSDDHSEFRWLTLEAIEADPEFKEWFKERIRKAANRIQEVSYLNDVQRLQADFENYKKRVKNEERELYGHLTSQIVAELVPVLTNLHAAASHVPKEAAESPWVMGITYIEKQFEDVLKNYGVEPIEVKPGDPFNPAEHEAVDHQPTEGKESAHQIEQVVQKGYKIKDRVIKAARVIVS